MIFDNGPFDKIFDFDGDGSVSSDEESAGLEIMDELGQEAEDEDDINEDDNEDETSD